MRFEEVLPMLRDGNRIRKNHWTEDMHLYLFKGKIRLTQGNLDVEWNPDMSDILKENWLPSV